MIWYLDKDVNRQESLRFHKSFDDKIGFTDFILILFLSPHTHTYRLVSIYFICRYLKYVV